MSITVDSASVVVDSTLWTISGVGPSEADFPAFTASGAGGVERTGEGTLTLPVFSVLGAGQAVIGGAGTPELPVFRVDGTGSVDANVAQGDGTISIPAFTVDGAGTVPEELFATGTLPLPRFAVDGTLEIGIQGEGEVALPAFVVSGPHATGHSILVPFDVDGAGRTRLVFAHASGRVSFAQFQRVNGRLHLAEVGRGGRTGFKRSESWEEVSGVFGYDPSESLDGREVAMGLVADAWATHSGADAATLTTAINEALRDHGFRRVDGSELS